MALHVHTSHATDENGAVVAYQEGWKYSYSGPGRPVITAVKTYLVVFLGMGDHNFSAELHAKDDATAIAYAAEKWSKPYRILEQEVKWREVK